MGWSRRVTRGIVTGGSGNSVSTREELTHVGEFKYAIINKDFETAKGELAEIIRKERAKPHGQNHR